MDSHYDQVMKKREGAGAGTRLVVTTAAAEKIYRTLGDAATIAVKLDVAAGATLAAYAFGLLPFVLIRSAVATFFARGDTATPVKAALLAAAVNIAFKFMLMGPLAQVGLALATAVGAWINLGLVVWFAHRAGHLVRGETGGGTTALLAPTVSHVPPPV